MTNSTKTWTCTEPSKKEMCIRERHSALSSKPCYSNMKSLGSKAKIWSLLTWGFSRGSKRNTSFALSRGNRCSKQRKIRKHSVGRWIEKCKGSSQKVQETKRKQIMILRLRTRRRRSHGRNWWLQLNQGIAKGNREDQGGPSSSPTTRMSRYPYLVMI